MQMLLHFVNQTFENCPIFSNIAYVEILFDNSSGICQKAIISKFQVMRPSDEVPISDIINRCVDATLLNEPIKSKMIRISFLTSYY